MKVALGVFVALFGMWGSAYLGHVLDKWAELPAIITAILSVVFGFAIITPIMENSK